MDGICVDVTHGGSGWADYIPFVYSADCSVVNSFERKLQVCVEHTKIALHDASLLFFPSSDRITFNK